MYNEDGMGAITTVIKAKCGIGCDRYQGTVRSGKGVVTAMLFTLR